MLSSVNTPANAVPKPTVAATSMPVAPQLATEPSLDLLELELSLDGFTAGEAGFRSVIRDAARKLGGELLFELPASGLADDCRKIAALRLPDADRTSMRTVFACLSADATSIRIEEPGERTAGLERFAEAFVDVLQRI